MKYEDEISAWDFLQWLEQSERSEGLAIDVREEMEWDYYHLAGTAWMPMKTIPARINELPKESPIYVLCAHGARSASVCDYLQRMGFTNSINVVGGMAAVSAYKGFQYD